MNNLGTVSIVDNIGATHEPITEPLIRDVSPHTVVRRRGNHPLETDFRCFWLKRLGLTTVRQSNGSFSVGRYSVVAFCSSFDYRQDINWLRIKITTLPEPYRISWFGSICARALVGEIARKGLLLRAMQSSQDNAAQCNTGVRGTVFKETFSESAKCFQHFRVKCPLPELASRDLTWLIFSENAACFREDFIHSGRYELSGRNGCSHRAGVYPKGMEVDETCRKIGGSPTAKWIKHNIALTRSPPQYVQRKFEREHREVGTYTVQSRITQLTTIAHLLTLIHVFPVVGFLNVSHAACWAPNTAFIAFGTKL